MPVLIPTPAEAARLSSVKRYRMQQRARHAHQAAQDAMRALVIALDTEFALDRTWLADWPVMVRDDARAILAALPPDPDASAHRAAVTG